MQHRPFRAAVSLLLLLFAAGSAALAQTSPTPAAALAAQLDKAERQAARLRSQIEHPRGRPQAAEELVELMRHLERLQRATADLGPADGASHEERRAALLSRLRHPERASGQESAPLAGGGAIAGRVEGPAGQPLAGVRVVVYEVGSYYAGSQYTDAAGAYQVSGLADGAYFVATDASLSSPYLNETYDDVHCASYGPCHPELSEQILVVGGATVGQIDFRLSEGGKLRGRVFDENGLPLAGVYVNAYTASAQSAGQTVTDAAGRYTLGRLMPGSYFLQAVSDRHLDELYPDIPCENGCSIVTGAATTVALASQVVGLDFALRSRGTVRGRVIDAASQLPLSFADVYLHFAAGNQTRSVSANYLGEWEIGDLPPGTYYARAGDFDYQPQLYEGIPCDPSGCTAASGTPIVLQEGGTAEGVDFALHRLGAISGTLTAGDTLETLAERVEIYDAEGYYERSEWGPEYLADGLQPGPHYVRTDVGYDSEYGDELWQNLPCQDDCEVTGGTPVAVSLAQTVSGIDFVLERLGRIEGRVLAGSGEPLLNTLVTSYSVDAAAWSSSAYTDQQGHYRLDQLAAGGYKVRASGENHRAEIWNGVVCPEPCDPSLGQAIAVNLGQTSAGIDFTLERLGYLAGTAVDETSGQPLANMRVEIRNADGYYIDDALTDAKGAYESRGLADGTYFAMANRYSDHGYLAEIYSGIDCRICPVPEDGSPVAVSVESPRLDVSFTLRKGGRIVGRVVSAAGSPGGSGYVDAYDAAGVPMGSGSFSSDGRYSIAGLPAGGYYLVAAIFNIELAREVWPDVVCSPNGSCNLFAGTPVTVALGATATADFALDSWGRVEGKLIDTETGEGIAGGFAYLVTPQGDYIGSQAADELGRYQIAGIVPGVYRLYTRHHDAHIERVLGGAACENEICDVAAGSPVVVHMGQKTVAPDLPLAFGPGLAGWVRREGSAAQGVAIDVFSPGGSHLETVASDGQGRWRVSLPAGSYFLATDNGPLFVDEVYSDLPCPNGPAYLGLCDSTAGDAQEAPAGQPAADGLIFDLESRTALFRDGFESGGLGAWSQVLGN